LDCFYSQILFICSDVQS